MAGTVQMEMDENGNIKPDPSKIAELQAKQDREDKEKKDYMKYLEDKMLRGEDLWVYNNIIN